MYVLVLQPSVKLDIVYMHVAQDHGSGQVIRKAPQPKRPFNIY